MDFVNNIRFKIKSIVERYGDYVRLNRNLIASIATSMVVSALFSQALKGQTEYLNATLTILVSYATYYLVFGSLYYRDNKAKYITKDGTVNRKKLRKDFLKLVSSVGAAEIIFFIISMVFSFSFFEYRTRALPGIINLSCNCCNSVCSCRQCWSLLYQIIQK